MTLRLFLNLDIISMEPCLTESKSDKSISIKFILSISILENIFSHSSKALLLERFKAIISQPFLISGFNVFNPTPDSPDSIILLDAQKGRWDFPELKRVAYEEYKYWDPDMTLIESKASGTPLTHELRRLGIPVVNYSPTRGHDKSTRMHSVAPIFESGLVWAPERKFAEDMIEECAAFPFGKNDDLCDTMSQALMRFREGGLVSLHDDYADEERPVYKRAYY